MEKEEKQDRELEVLKMYLEDIKAIKPQREGERDSLITKLNQGDMQVKERLMELYLTDAVKLAAEYGGQGLSLADLIQEANIGLLTAFASGEKLNDSVIRKSMKSSMEAALESQGYQNALGSRLAEEANRLDEVSRMLTEQNGEAPTIQELAEYLHCTEEEVREYLKLSLNALNIAGN